VGRVTPEWTPPPELSDPYGRRAWVVRNTWTRVIRGHIPELRDAAVALTIAGYANKQGSGARPGLRRLADDLRCSPRTITRALAWLIEAGWLTVTERGRRKLGEADTYRLTLPAPLTAHLGVWSDEPQWMTRPPSEPKRTFLEATDVLYKPSFLEDTADPYNELLEANGDSCNATFLEDSSGPKKKFLEATDEFLGAKTVFSRGLSYGHPPELRHQEKRHHSDLLDPPSRAYARAGTDERTRTRERAREGVPDNESKIDGEEDLALVETITEIVETKIGGPVTTNTLNMIDAMVANNSHPNATINAAIKAETA